MLNRFQDVHRVLTAMLPRHVYIYEYYNTTNCPIDNASYKITRVRDPSRVLEIIHGRVQSLIGDYDRHVTTNFSRDGPDGIMVFEIIYGSYHHYFKFRVVGLRDMSQFEQ